MPQSLCDFQITAANHFGMVVRDVSNMVDSYTRMLGLGPWEVFDYTTTEKEMIYGEPFKLKIAAARVSDWVLELLQPLTPNSVWAEYLREKGEGLHHVAVVVPDWDATAAKLTSQGAKILVAAEVPKFDGRRFGYFDTKQAGLVIEIMENYGLFRP